MAQEYKTIEELEAARAARQAKKLLKKRKKNKRTRIGAICIIAIILIAGIATMGTLAFRDINGVGGDEKFYVIDVPAGAGASKVSNLLANRSIIKYPSLFAAYAGNKYMFQQGRHSVNSSMSYKELLNVFANYAEGGIGEQVQIVIPEGYELRQIADVLEQKGLVDRDEFMEEVNHGEFDNDFINDIPREENRLEGYLYPATYKIFSGTSAHDIVQMMLDAFKNNVIPVYNKSNTSDSIDYVITMASVIEREAANDEEKKVVSSVFNNRIYDGKKLESCATIQYVLKERKAILSEADTKINSEYNTYKYKGLPIGPIASPGLVSIKAALYPDETNYMFFVSDSSGDKNYFSNTYEEHKEKIEKIENGEEVTDSPKSSWS